MSSRLRRVACSTASRVVKGSTGKPRLDELERTDLIGEIDGAARRGRGRADKGAAAEPARHQSGLFELIERAAHGAARGVERCGQVAAQAAADRLRCRRRSRWRAADRRRWRATPAARLCRSRPRPASACSGCAVRVKLWTSVLDGPALGPTAKIGLQSVRDLALIESARFDSNVAYFLDRVHW